MTDHEFTEAEQAAIEQAAAEHLSAFLTDRDAEEVGYDFAHAIRDAMYRAAVEKLVEVNHLDLDVDYEDRYQRGACAAVRGMLRHLDQAAGESR